MSASGKFFRAGPDASCTDLGKSVTYFRHEPLDTTKRSIRVISILSGADDAIIECTVQQVDLNDADYICLSYTWGSEEDTKTITMNGQPFLVYSNLWTFLLRAREKEINVPLWIDMLSIDQTALEERNHQVQMMADIYRNASHVIAWLGASDSALDEVLLTIGGSSGKFVRPAMKGMKRGEARSIWQRLDERISPCFDETHWMAFRQLCWNGYWSRLWIVQEIHLACSLTIMCGSVCVAWSLLIKFTRLVLIADDTMVRYKFGERKVGRSLAENIITLASLRREESFISIIFRFRHHICREWRDHVYGLTGLMGDGNQFIVNYAEDSVSLCRRVVGFEGKLRASQRKDDFREKALTLLHLMEAGAGWLVPIVEERKIVVLRPLMRLLADDYAAKRAGPDVDHVAGQEEAELWSQVPQFCRDWALDRYQMFRMRSDPCKLLAELKQTTGAQPTLTGNPLPACFNCSSGILGDIQSVIYPRDFLSDNDMSEGSVPSTEVIAGYISAAPENTTVPMTEAVFSSKFSRQPSADEQLYWVDLDLNIMFDPELSDYHILWKSREYEYRNYGPPAAMDAPKRTVYRRITGWRCDSKDCALGNGVHGINFEEYRRRWLALNAPDLLVEKPHSQGLPIVDGPTLLEYDGLTREKKSRWRLHWRSDAINEKLGRKSGK